MYYTRFDPAITPENPRLIIIGEINPNDAIYGLQTDANSYCHIRENYPFANPRNDVERQIDQVESFLGVSKAELINRLGRVDDRPVNDLANYLARSHNKIASAGKFDLILLSNIFSGLNYKAIGDIFCDFKLISNTGAQIIFSFGYGHPPKVFAEDEKLKLIEKYIGRPITRLSG
ncbi:MAG: hypothetical protein IPQ11_18400 [Bacteroidetes bacterium]|nr:hypothetical protein [Bacteroidota bacterium]